MFALLGCYGKCIGSCLATFWDRLSVSSSRVFLVDGTGRISRNVGKHQHTLHNNPEERRPHLDVGGNLKSD
jgi:hypothetical protein